MRLSGFGRKLRKVSLVIAAQVAAMTPAATQVAWAQGEANYPTRPIRMVVGFAAGGGNDLLARIIGQKLSENIGQPVVIENKTGAGGRLAVEYAQGQPADGYTLVVGATGQLAVATAIDPKLPFHPTRTLVPLTMLASYPLVIAGPMNDAIKSVRDLIAFAKANPDKANYPTSSPVFTITSEMFKLKTGIPGQAIPYKSSNEMMLSVVAQQTLFAISDPSSILPLAQSGKIRALAVAGSARLAELPDTPTMAEVGLADVDIRPQWSGGFLVAATPPAITRKLEAELRRVLADTGVRAKIRAMAYEGGGGPGEEFRQRIDTDIKVFADVIKAANLKFE
jgi:tripartite-type tricarboxylate transporter receptor subunit TctC